MVKIPLSDLTNEQRDALKTVGTVVGGLSALGLGAWGYWTYTKKSRAMKAYLKKIDAATTLQELSNIEGAINNDVANGNLAQEHLIALQAAIVNKKQAINSGVGKASSFVTTCTRCGGRLLPNFSCPRCSAATKVSRWPIPMDVNGGV